jgi:hypothetical protein
LQGLGKSFAILKAAERSAFGSIVLTGRRGTGDFQNVHSTLFFKRSQTPVHTAFGDIDFFFQSVTMNAALTYQLTFS